MAKLLEVIDRWEMGETTAAPKIANWKIDGKFIFTMEKQLFTNWKIDGN